MKNMKKSISLIMLMAVIANLVACSQNVNNNVSKTDTTEQISEEEAWKKEPAYGKPIKYYISDGCTSGPVVADLKGFYQEEGLIAEGVKGKTDVEMLGTKNADVAVGHVAKQLVPATNGVDIVFVGGAHVLEGCKGLYVASDSPVQYIEDLKGKKISCPNGIGASDYNITARLLDLCGVNPLTEAKLVAVENSACVPAMQNGELDAALFSYAFAYDMVNDGKLRLLESKSDSHKDKLCCAISMNASFVKENPITARKAARAVKKALNWMGENPEEATDLLLQANLNSGSREKNIELNDLMQFGMTDEETEIEMKNIVEDYIKLGLLTATKDANEVMNKVWIPLN